MFLGHYGLAFAAKKVAPRVSLPALFVAVQFVDILWPFLLLSGIEKVNIDPSASAVTPFEFVHYPFTHSLLMGIVWGLVLGFFYWLSQRDMKGAWVIGLAVLSHWFLDLVVHVPDLPLTPFGETKVGFGLWESMPLTLLVEAVIFFGGIYIYIKNSKPANARQKWSLGILIGFFTVGNLYNMFGPPPENNIPALFVTFTILQIIILTLAHFADKDRSFQN